MFYEQFIKLCERDNVSPAYVAKEIGLSNSATTYWKRGSVPKYETIKKLADYFKVKTEYLTNSDAEKIQSFDSPTEFEIAWMKATGTTHLSSDDRKNMLIKTFDKLDAEDQLQHIRYGELLAGQPKYRDTEQPEEE